MRLSMSLDGKAELVSAESSPPPPDMALSASNPGVPRRRLGALQRSYSALPMGSSARKSSFSSLPFLPRMPAGRSRDARTWEFCCDADARDELTTQAENESNGSAVAAISLLRSTSSNALKPNANKRNAPATKANPLKHDKKRKLGRAQSSLARLQGTTGKVTLHSTQRPSYKPKPSGETAKSPSADSDKENWLPLENGTGNYRRRRPLPTPQDSARRRVLADNRQTTATHTVVMGDATRARGRKTNKGGNEAEIFEDANDDDEGNEDRARRRGGGHQKDKEDVPVVDKEVERFMRGDISPSKKGDLDCVQGLLSLSQGNWR